MGNDVLLSRPRVQQACRHSVQGRNTGVFMSFTDRTDLVHANARVFEQLLDRFPDIIQSVDEDGVLVYVNRRATELLGYERDELLGMNIRDLYAREVWPGLEKGFAHLKAHGSLQGVESMVQARDGTRIPVEIRSFAVYDEDGDFLRTFSILRDVREVRDLRDRLIHSNRLAAIGELAACIAHDISNPLAVVQLYGEMLQRELETVALDDGAAFDDILSGIRRAARTIERLVSHLRDFSRKQQMETAPVDMPSLIEDALFLVSGRIEEGRSWSTAAETSSSRCS